MLFFRFFFFTSLYINEHETFSPSYNQKSEIQNSVNLGMFRN